MIPEQYNLPLTADAVGVVRDSNNAFMFQFETYDSNLISKIMEILNGKQVQQQPRFYLMDDEVRRLENDKVVIKIRGWSYLTNKLNLTPMKAKQVQDSVGMWIVSKLNGKD